MPGAVGFRVVVRGGCVLVPAGAEPVRLVAGDVVLLPHGRGHVLADSPATPPAARACDPPTEDRPLALADMPEAATVTLCGAYELAPEGGHPLLQDLPEVIHLDTRAGGLSELRTVVDMLGAEAARPRLGTDAAIPALLDMLLLYALRPGSTTPGPAPAPVGRRRCGIRPSRPRCTPSTGNRRIPGRSRRSPRSRAVPGPVRQKVHRTGRAATDALPDLVADDNGGPAAARVRRAARFHRGCRRLSVGIRARRGVQTPVRDAARQVPAVVCSQPRDALAARSSSRALSR